LPLCADAHKRQSEVAALRSAYACTDGAGVDFVVGAVDKLLDLGLVRPRLGHGRHVRRYNHHRPATASTKFTAAATRTSQTVATYSTRTLVVRCRIAPAPSE